MVRWCIKIKSKFLLEVVTWGECGGTANFYFSLRLLLIVVEDESHYIFEIDKALRIYLLYLIVLVLSIFHQGEQILSCQVFYLDV